MLQKWLVEGAPVGVAHPVECGGVFPSAVPQEVSESALAEAINWEEPRDNYKSVVDEPRRSGAPVYVLHDA